MLNECSLFELVSHSKCRSHPRDYTYARCHPSVVTVTRFPCVFRGAFPGTVGSANVDVHRVANPHPIILQNSSSNILICKVICGDA